MTENKILHQLQAVKAHVAKLLDSASAGGTTRGHEYRTRSGFGRVEQKLRGVFKR
ncbi:hypothetical protein NDR87_36590 [Nocardia sp. CDC159]|uniref:Uncharacterized protein n=1 Tax=Nocardia pulmonis TaxID=2951408 RepID=A0A9X2EDQ9_9NOCA|nr:MULTISPECIES: hypothetical protein [Nocardia]MCM6779009.1 hypothetical protein [Nocardia pulmonis]MCM6791895.1 hypothetical protein [Nocardia sp. CDC159]